jgi:hypothetical protein
MNRTENPDPRGRTLTTADLAAAGRRPPDTYDAERDDAERHEEQIERDDERAAARERDFAASPDREKPDPLFSPDVAERYRSRWAAVQSGFVDDPRRAASQGDELVAEVMKNLADSFARERQQLDQQLSESGEAATETLRVGLRRYRSFFDRLLSL